MIDNRLIEADATKLDELRKIIKEQENAEKLCDITMKEIVNTVPQQRYATR